MARKKRRSGRGFRVGKWVNLAFKGIGAVIALSPSFRGLTTMIQGNAQGGAGQIVYDYVGFDTTSGAFQPTKAVQGVGTVLAGFVVMKLGSMIARRL